MAISSTRDVLDVDASTLRACVAVVGGTRKRKLKHTAVSCNEFRQRVFVRSSVRGDARPRGFRARPRTMPAFGSSSKTGRLLPDKPRRDPSASSSSTKDEGRSTKDARRSPSKDSGGDVRAASRVPKPALAPATPSPTSHAPSTRPRAPVPPGRDPPKSARGSPTPSRRSTPARTSASAETKNASFSRVREGVTAVRNLLFEEGPKTYCAVDAPFCVSAGHQRVSPTPSPIDPIDPIEASSAPDDALALALRIPADPRRVVDASTLSSSSPRLAELRLADETWRRVALRIARTGGERGDALAASAREVFRRLAAAMPPETSEKKKKKTHPRRVFRRVSFDAAGDVSPLLSSPRAPSLFSSLLFDSDERESGSMSGPHVNSGLPRVRLLTFLGSRGFFFRGISAPSAAARLARFALAALALVAVGAALASVAPLASGAFHAHRRSEVPAFERDAPPPS